MFIASFVTGPEPIPHRRALPRSGSAGEPPRPEPSRLAALLAWVRESYRLHRSRRYLARLDAHLLKDIGLSYAEAEHEINKPFWRC